MHLTSKRDTNFYLSDPLSFRLCILSPCPSLLLSRAIWVDQAANPVQGKVCQNVGYKAQQERLETGSQDPNTRKVGHHKHGVVIMRIANVSCCFLQPRPGWWEQCAFSLKCFAIEHWHVILQKVLHRVPCSTMTLLHRFTGFCVVVFLC